MGTILEEEDLYSLLVTKNIRVLWKIIITIGKEHHPIR